MKTNISRILAGLSLAAVTLLGSGFLSGPAHMGQTLAQGTPAQNEAADLAAAKAKRTQTFQFLEADEDSFSAASGKTERNHSFGKAWEKPLRPDDAKQSKKARNHLTQQLTG